MVPDDRFGLIQLQQEMEEQNYYYFASLHHFISGLAKAF